MTWLCSLSPVLSCPSAVQTNKDEAPSKNAADFIRGVIAGPGLRLLDPGGLPYATFTGLAVSCVK